MKTYKLTLYGGRETLWAKWTIDASKAEALAIITAGHYEGAIVAADDLIFTPRAFSMIVIEELVEPTPGAIPEGAVQ